MKAAVENELLFLGLLGW